MRRAPSFIDRHPQTRRYLLALINRLGLHGIARTLYVRFRCRIGFAGRRSVVREDIAHLTPRARQVYADLKVAIERRQKENS